MARRMDTVGTVFAPIDPGDLSQWHPTWDIEYWDPASALLFLDGTHPVLNAPDFKFRRRAEYQALREGCMADLADLVVLAESINFLREHEERYAAFGVRLRQIRESLERIISPTTGQRWIWGPYERRRVVEMRDEILQKIQRRKREGGVLTVSCGKKNFRLTSDDLTAKEEARLQEAVLRSHQGDGQSVRLANIHLAALGLETFRETGESPQLRWDERKFGPKKVNAWLEEKRPQLQGDPRAKVLATLLLMRRELDDVLRKEMNYKDMDLEIDLNPLLRVLPQQFIEQDLDIL